MVSLFNFSFSSSSYSTHSPEKIPPTEVSLYFHCACGEMQESIGKDDEALAVYKVWLPQTYVTPHYFLHFIIGC